MTKIILLIITITFSINAYSDNDSFAPKGSDLYNKFINENFPESLKYDCKSDHTEFTISVLEGDISDDYKSGLLIQEDGLFLTMYRFTISDRRWDWTTGDNNFAFIIKGNKGMYYDFTDDKGEKVAPSAYFTCTKIETNKYIEPAVLDVSIEADETESDDLYE